MGCWPSRASTVYTSRSHSTGRTPVRHVAAACVASCLRETCVGVGTLSRFRIGQGVCLVRLLTQRDDLPRPVDFALRWTTPAEGRVVLLELLQDALRLAEVDLATEAADHHVVTVATGRASRYASRSWQSTSYAAMVPYCLPAAVAALASVVSLPLNFVVTTLPYVSLEKED